jgi:hypothetical protein
MTPQKKKKKKHVMFVIKACDLVLIYILKMHVRPQD